jgi:hypothetical protein
MPAHNTHCAVLQHLHLRRHVGTLPKRNPAKLQMNEGRHQSIKTKTCRAYHQARYAKQAMIESINKNSDEITTEEQENKRILAPTRPALDSLTILATPLP